MSLIWTELSAKKKAEKPQMHYEIQLNFPIIYLLWRLERVIGCQIYKIYSQSDKKVTRFVCNARYKKANNAIREMFAIIR